MSNGLLLIERRSFGDNIFCFKCIFSKNFTNSDDIFRFMIF